MTKRPDESLRPTDSSALIHQAEAHGVLPAVLANAREGDDLPAAALSQAAARLNAATGLSLLLRQRATSLTAAAEAEGIRLAVVKGPVFAERLYPERRLRRFTDIDILVSPDDEARSVRLLTQMGYTLSSITPEASAIESNWLDPLQPAVVLDVQTDLVHAPSVKHALSLRYEHLAGEDGRADKARPSALLVMASIHGAMHQYTRLIHLVDICQAGRAFAENGGDDLERLLQAGGSRFAVSSGLLLAGRVFGEPRCLDLAARLGLAAGTASIHSLLHERVLTSSMTGAGWIHSWRRKLFREMIKRAAR